MVLYDMNYNRLLMHTKNLLEIIDEEWGSALSDPRAIIAKKEVEALTEPSFGVMRLEEIARERAETERSACEAHNTKDEPFTDGIGWYKHTTVYEDEAPDKCPYVGTYEGDTHICVPNHWWSMTKMKWVCENIPKK